MSERVIGFGLGICAAAIIVMGFFVFSVADCSFERINAVDALNKMEIDIELEKSVSVWLFATDEGRVIYYDGKLFKATGLE